MKRLVSLLMLIIFVFSFLCSCQKPTESLDNSNPSKTEETTVSEDENIIKIGVFEPLSGKDSYGGKAELVGIKYANELRNKVKIGEEEYKIELVVADTKSTDSGAVEAAQNLVSKNVNAVIGSYGCDSVFEAADIFNNAGIPVVSPTMSGMGLCESYSNIFSLGVSNNTLGEKIALYLYRNLGKRKICTVSVLGNDESQSTVLYFTNEFNDLGGKVINLKIEKDEDDFSSVISRAVEEKCDAFFLPISYSYAPSFISEIKNNEVSIPIVSTYAWDIGAIFKPVEDSTVIAYTMAFCKSDSTSEFDNAMREWVNSNKQIKSLNGQSNVVSSISLMSFDAYDVLINSMADKNVVSGKKLIKAIKKVSFNGKSGKIKFDSDGKTSREALYMKKTNNFTGHFGILIEI